MRSAISNVVTAAFLPALLLSACVADPEGEGIDAGPDRMDARPDGTDGRPDSADSGSCEMDAIDDCYYFLYGATFTSVDDHEVGLGADGEPVMGSWTVTFAGRPASTFDWSHSDMVESGAYACSYGSSDYEIEVTGTGAAESPSGDYHFCTGILTWNGTDYRRNP